MSEDEKSTGFLDGGQADNNSKEYEFFLSLTLSSH